MQSVVLAGKTLIVSPHLDDAVLSCGFFLSGPVDATVLSVFAGMPSDPQLSTAYDRQCGFSSAGQAMKTRWREDDQALAMLGVQTLRLSVLDSQYAPLPETGELAALLAPILTDPHWDTVIVPMGLFHCDHECVTDACLDVMRAAIRESSKQWLLYEDVPYRRRAGVMQRRLAWFNNEGWVLAPAALEADPKIPPELDPIAAKRASLACYGSQLVTLGLSNGGDQDAPERFWSVTTAD